MYEIAVQSVFRAAHAITMAGVHEDSHEHDWRVEVLIGGDDLDEDGLLCDFHVVERELNRIIEPFREADLNRTAPFDRLNPTAEHVARHIAVGLEAALRELSGMRARVSEVTVTEAPGCRARYRPCRAQVGQP